MALSQILLGLLTLSLTQLASGERASYGLLKSSPEVMREGYISGRQARDLVDSEPIRCSSNQTCQRYEKNSICKNTVCVCLPGLAFDSSTGKCTSNCEEWCEKTDPLAQCSSDGKKCGCKEGALYFVDADICVDFRTGCQYACFELGGLCRMKGNATADCLCKDGSLLDMFGEKKCPDAEQD